MGTVTIVICKRKKPFINHEMQYMHLFSTFAFFLLSTTEETANVRARTLCSAGNRACGARSTRRNTTASVLGLVHGRVSVATKGASTVRSLVVLAAALSTVDALFRGHVADRLEETAFAELIADSVVDIALELVDRLDASDLGLVKLF